MGEGGGGEEKGSFSPSALSFFGFHLSPFPQKRLILRLLIPRFVRFDRLLSSKKCHVVSWWRFVL